MQDKIPKRFKLMGRTITVEFDDKLFTKEDKHGEAIFREGKIKLQPVSDGYAEETITRTKDLLIYLLAYCIRQHKRWSINEQ